MKMEDYYTKDEIAHMCWYYGQYSDNLTYNMKAMLVEKFEDMIGDKLEEILIVRVIKKENEMRTEKQEKMRRFSVRLFDIILDYKLTEKEEKLIEEVRDFLHEIEEGEGNDR